MTDITGKRKISIRLQALKEIISAFAYCNNKVKDYLIQKFAEKRPLSVTQVYPPGQKLPFSVIFHNAYLTKIIDFLSLLLAVD